MAISGSTNTIGGKYSYRFIFFLYNQRTIIKASFMIFKIINLK
ncbi:hypothetical protein BN134_3451 [Cronobacter dublinensis 1210]|uniref:Uncharacterized protein n=1 Tax=Cronobacter dublinensis 1210 TaxID=1208656 RepID=A0ABM9QAX3_9ENTR|nr:hypothetical protein BN134_3451 [Cronobacter dublinensis 1210]